MTEIVVAIDSGNRSSTDRPGHLVLAVLFSLTGVEKLYSRYREFPRTSRRVALSHEQTKRASSSGRADRSGRLV
jgi:hypothetical protein